MNLNFMEIIWIVWGVAFVAWLVTLMYQSQITSNEEDQLFLSGNQEVQHREQEEILSKVHRLQPILRTLATTTGILTVAIIGYYAWDAVQHLL